MQTGGGGDGGRINTGTSGKPKWDTSGVFIFVWGVRMGPLWSQMIDFGLWVTDGVG